MVNVLVIQPGFPAEIPYFVRGLAQVGANVLGLGDQPESLLPEVARSAISAYLRVPHMWNEAAVIEAVKRWQIPCTIDQVECLWEPGMTLAAKLRQALGIPGMNEEQTRLFRDKEQMKLALDRAGIRTPKHASARTAAAVWEAVETIGYPLIIKPIAGAGSANTFRISDEAELRQVLPGLRHVDEVVIEEFVEGQEYTFDTICARGRILYENVAWYRPNVLVARSEEWISPQTITLRDTDDPGLQRGIELGRSVLKALSFQSGFTHMEWFLKPNGEAVFGEIAARPPGGRSVELMNYGCDIDVFKGWGEAVIKGRLSQEITRKYNAAVVFKRAQGRGTIRRIVGLDEILSRFGPHIVSNRISPIGTPRRNWKQTLISDGYIILRHPDLEQTKTMINYIGEHLQLFAAQ